MSNEHKLPAHFVESPVIKKCSNCGSMDCGKEAALKWDSLHQQWAIATIYDSSDFCNNCASTNGENEILEMQVADDYERSFTIFLRQSNGHGTTHISVQRAVNEVLALAKAKAEASADWGNWPIKDITGVGIIAGDVDVIAWDDEANLSEAESKDLPSTA